MIIKFLCDPSMFCRSTPNGAATAKRRCKEDSSYDAQQHETSSGASGVMKLNTSSGTTSIATAANSVPQGRDLDHRPIATRITSPTNHLTSRISHRHEDRSNDEKNRS
ncbi:hypothetical protein H4Q26_003651 [Puccinia striiformis f. sp. tritici PST-130]|uniref:Uncharacterized protein n=1 Tax=Puccinia striiformis f. sp. tritici PST-78 TaxID=1165861 RepID=A0A0L0VSB1_9BASI|nr:hypothetical protein H4Q26_003651 [Puccinia striiformis f. sp. tritici PST-130]KNF02151.1 hypothetical protein PSTG_04648 [Puccinia striiformis f. sp. tritici PST-78]